MDENTTNGADHTRLTIATKIEDESKDKNQPFYSTRTYLNVTEIADRLGVGRFTIYALIKNKQRRFPHIWIGPRTLRFDPTAVDKWVEKQSLPL